MEIVQELPTVDYIIVPVGGGGLITGISTLAKMLNPKIKVIGAEPKSAASMTKALEKGEPVALASADTIADGNGSQKSGNVDLPLLSGKHQQNGHCGRRPPNRCVPGHGGKSQNDSGKLRDFCL